MGTVTSDLFTSNVSARYSLACALAGAGGVVGVGVVVVGVVVVVVGVVDVVVGVVLEVVLGVTAGAAEEVADPAVVAEPEPEADAAPATSPSDTIAAAKAAVQEARRRRMAGK
ncbi:MAG TPA: hypothetical protein VHX62_18560 [Solirubrobacteraceae bacterium]|nr:hypothetical protein [Solirubrobacteraceae bacterium]